MATTSFQLPQFTITTTPQVFGPRAIPTGTSGLDFTLDLTNLLAGDRIWLKIEWDDGSNAWAFMSLSDGIGPGLRRDKHTGLTSGMNSFSVGLGVPTPAGWQIRATVWSEVANVVVPSGSINLS